MATSCIKAGHPKSLGVILFHHGKLVYKKTWGAKYKFFDLASLTKIFVTNNLVMRLSESKQLDISKSADHYLSFLKNTSIGKIKIKHFLSHDSGLVWWRPFYETLVKFSQEERNSILKRMVKKERVGSKKKCIYSDVDYFVLGWIIEEVLEGPLDKWANKYVFSPLKLKNTFFITEKKKVNQFAPTEKHKLRGQIQGIVHDDNAWSLNGVAPHAGLFSTLEETGILANEFLNTYMKRSERIISTSTLRKFTKRQVPAKKGDWALGFMVPTKGQCSGGMKISSQAFGHTGFTGTSVWIDPKRDAAAVVLSNRTFPTRDNIEFRNIRPRIHDILWEMIDE